MLSQFPPANGAVRGTRAAEARAWRGEGVCVWPLPPPPLFPDGGAHPTTPESTLC